MRRSTLFLSLGSCALAALSGWLYHERREQTAVIAELRAQLDQSQHPATSPEPEGPPLAGTSPPKMPLPPADPSPGAGPTPDMVASWNAWSAREAKLRAHPKVAAALTRFRMLEMAPWRESLAHALGVSDAQATRILEYWIALELASDTPGASPPDDRALRELIGDATFARLDDFRASMPARARVSELRMRLAPTGSPLREEQIEPLVAIVQAEWATYRREVSEYSRTLDWSPGNEVKAHRLRDARIAEINESASERIRAAAVTVLSAAQVAELEAMQRERRELEAAREAMFRAQSEVTRGAAVAKSD